MEQSNQLKSLIVIVNAGYADDIIKITRGEGAGGATILNARGEGPQHKVFMGITIDTEKEIILCLADERTTDKIMAAIKETAGIKTPAHAVCFTLPVEKMIGIRTPAPSDPQ